jgi:hypothetical protein
MPTWHDGWRLLEHAIPAITVERLLRATTIVAVRGPCVRGNHERRKRRYFLNQLEMAEEKLTNEDLRMVRL